MNTELYNWLKLIGYEAQQASNLVQLHEELLVKEKSFSKERALNLAHKIRPIMSKNSNGELEFSFGNSPRGKKFWVNTKGIYVYGYPFEDMPIAQAEGLTIIKEITTYHRCGIDNSLRPSVFEVLYQIPQELLERVSAFELYCEYKKEQDAYLNGLKMHHLKCLLYKGNMPQSVQSLPTKW